MEGKVNLNELDTAAAGERGIELELKTPDGRALPGRMLIRGYDSPTYQNALDEQQRRRLLKASTVRQVPTVEQLKADEIELLVGLVAGWTIPFELDGKRLEYSADAARVLLERFRWIREQVDRAAAMRANFLPGSSSS